MTRKVKYRVVFRARKTNGPRIGLPDAVQVGDWLVFFVDRRAISRQVAEVHRGYVITAPLRAGRDEAHKVWFNDFHEAHRLVGGTDPTEDTELLEFLDG